MPARNDVIKACFRDTELTLDEDAITKIYFEGIELTLNEAPEIEAEDNESVPESDFKIVDTTKLQEYTFSAELPVNLDVFKRIFYACTCAKCQKMKFFKLPVYHSKPMCHSCILKEMEKEDEKSRHFSKNQKENRFIRCK